MPNRLASDHCVHAGTQAFRGLAFAGIIGGLGRTQGTEQHRRGLTFLRVKDKRSRLHRQSVRLADDRQTTISIGKSILHHLPDDSRLLGILLAKIGLRWLNRIE